MTKATRTTKKSVNAVPAPPLFPKRFNFFGAKFEVHFQDVLEDFRNMTEQFAADENITNVDDHVRSVATPEALDNWFKDQWTFADVIQRGRRVSDWPVMNDRQLLTLLKFDTPDIELLDYEVKS